jgi:hypothetical protein
MRQTWQQKETAPKYKPVLVTDGKDVWVASWGDYRKNHEAWRTIRLSHFGGEAAAVLSVEFTHWTHLPEPPKGGR